MPTKRVKESELIPFSLEVACPKCTATGSLGKKYGQVQERNFYPQFVPGYQGCDKEGDYIITPNHLRVSCNTCGHMQYMKTADEADYS